jgi:hypothetical protein
LNAVNTIVRLIVMTFVLVGVAITLGGAQLVTGENISSREKSATTSTPNSAELTSSAKQSRRAIAETAG